MGVRTDSAPARPAWTALPWLDWRLTRNRPRSILRTPRRLAPWLRSLGLLAPNLLTRLAVTSAAGRGRVAAIPLAVVLEPAGPFVAGAALVLLGVALWQARGRPPAAFQSPA